jgi:methylated-DNA-[protein]-cysteine S-methyltransferase
MTEYMEFECPLGTMRIAANPDGICGAYFRSQKYFPTGSDWRESSNNKDLVAARKQLLDYFAGKRTVFQLRLAARGTPFQQRVWKALYAIPFGVTATYSGVAEKLRAPNSTRAVAAAVGRNPIGIIVPCHRVLGKDGSLTGFAGGLERKEALLQLEGIHMPTGALA